MQMCKQFASFQDRFVSLLQYRGAIQGTPGSSCPDSTSHKQSKKDNLINPPHSVKKQVVRANISSISSRNSHLSPIRMNFGTSRRTNDLPQWVNQKTSDWDTLLKFCGK